MLKAIFSLTEQRYPQVVRWIVLAVGAIGLFTWLTASPDTEGVVVIWIITVLCLVAALLVERFYVPVVFGFCLILNVLVAVSGIFLYELNNSSEFSLTTIGIVLSGLLLGGLGATVTTVLTLIMLFVGEMAIVGHWLPVPATVSTTDTGSVMAGIFDNAILIVVIYLAVVFFAHVIRQGLFELGHERNELAAALSQLQQRQELERQTGGAIVEVMMQLGSIATEQLSSVQEQVTALAQVSTTVEELSHTALAIANNASEVESAAQHALSAVGSSQDAVNDSLQATVLIRSQVQQIVERIVALNERISRINEVTTAVSNIAAKTHLLALNAAIEAAGAGQAGERFAIVASEVKKLAQQSQGEATRIRELVIEVQKANAASVMATEQGLKDADKGAAQARKSAETNLEVIELVEATSSRAKSITMSTQQQRSASEQVVETMRHLRIAAQGIADTAAMVNGTIAQLSAMATQLGILIGEQPHDDNHSRTVQAGMVVGNGGLKRSATVSGLGVARHRR